MYLYMYITMVLKNLFLPGLYTISVNVVFSAYAFEGVRTYVNTCACVSTVLLCPIVARESQSLSICFWYGRYL